MIIDKIRRITRDGRWIPEIDGLRFIAIVSVVLFHLQGELAARNGAPLFVEPRYGVLYTALNNGDRGVELFFVISGMILAMPFARYYLAAGKQVSLWKYYMRRVTRLEPPYILSVLLFTAMVAVYTHGHMTPDFGRHALASMFYLHSAFYNQMSPVNPVTWSLEVEIQFYVLAPLAMQLFRIPGKRVRRAVLAGTVLLLGLAQLATGNRGQLFLTYHAQYFLMGLLLADVMVLDLEQMRTSAWWDLAALASLLLMLETPRSSQLPHILLPYLFALICLAALRSRVFRRFVSTPSVAVIGGMCYSIYLLHFATLAAVFKLSRRLVLPRFDYLGNYLIQAVLIGMPILLVSTAFFLLVERPCMDPDWPGKLWHRITGRSTHDADLLDTAGIGPNTTS